MEFQVSSPLRDYSVLRGISQLFIYEESLLQHRTLIKHGLQTVTYVTPNTDVR